MEFKIHSQQNVGGQNSEQNLATQGEIEKGSRNEVRVQREARYP